MMKNLKSFTAIALLIGGINIATVSKVVATVPMPTADQFVANCQVIGGHIVQDGMTIKCLRKNGTVVITCDYEHPEVPFCFPGRVRHPVRPQVDVGSSSGTANSNSATTTTQTPSTTINIDGGPTKPGGGNGCAGKVC
jgi:hypothetical protein